METPDKKSLFKIKLDELKANKEKVYDLMRQQASDPETIAYYEQQAKELGDVDLEILDFEKNDETAYLLSNPNNAKALEESIQEIEQGETIRYKLLELKKKIGNKGIVNKYLVKSTFWDAEFEGLDLEKDKGYIISRIAERGTDIEVSFIISYYPKKDVLFVVNNAPEITPKTKNYFNTIVYENEK